MVPLALNATGYMVALQTLQQQFPYFIRKVSYEPLVDRGDVEGFFSRRKLDPSIAAGRASGAKDQGYVRPGGLRPPGVSRGLLQRRRHRRAVQDPGRVQAGGGGQARRGVEGEGEKPAEGETEAGR